MSVVLCDVGSRGAARELTTERGAYFDLGVPESSGTSCMATQGARAGSVGQRSQAFAHQSAEEEA